MKLTPFRLERYFARHEFSAPYLMCGSDCESMKIQDLMALEPGAALELLIDRLKSTKSNAAFLAEVAKSGQ